MKIFKSKESSVEKSAYDVMKTFYDDMHRLADEFNKKFPVGTFVKTWYQGQESYNTTFCYVAEKATVDLEETILTNYNIERYREYNNSKDNTPVGWRGVAINIWRINIEGPSYYDSQSFSIIERRTVEHSSIDEYRQYMSNRYQSDIQQYREEMLRIKQLIRERRQELRDIDRNIKKAEAIMNENYKKVIERNNKK